VHGGASAGCAITLSSSVSNVSAAGTVATVKLNAAPAACSWKASSSEDWAQVYPLSGQGNATLNYTIFPNFSTHVRSTVLLVGGKSVTLVQAASSDNINERFIRQVYFNCFGRIPSNVEVQFQSSHGLARGRAEMVTSFLKTAEFASGARFVAGLYTGLLGRDTEYNGWLFQRNAISTGQVNPITLVANFLNSEEYRIKYGVQTNAQFVQSLYKSILMRDAQLHEINLQSNALNTGMTRAQVASAFLMSAEFQAYNGPRLTAFLLFATLLNREPTMGELNSLASEIASRVPLNVSIDRILGSTEFQKML
jgi:hypothetical protein